MTTEIHHSRFKILKAWLTVSIDVVEVLLILGYVSVILSFYVDWLRLDQSGAIITGVAIFAAVFHQRNTENTEHNLRVFMGEEIAPLSYSQYRDSDTGQVAWIPSTEGDAFKRFPNGLKQDFSELPYYIISRKQIDDDGLITWSPVSVTKRVNNLELWVVAVSAIIGTGLWGFC